MVSKEERVNEFYQAFLVLIEFSVLFRVFAGDAVPDFLEDADFSAGGSVVELGVPVNLKGHFLS